ncbi:hypothetical protein BIV60_13845 [Bacillus sp. MUM 116]|uniref:hypothetical protein n=1 Tax=Bacillus sp. MUM 116 TaxID=1678002 RepID=UPI0008F5BB4F|nr:hypothetical protein [Bacillus sp. MUM 116]OIK13572.1 hypothetical protein BIV60_13845 [Bacillus sp. MUM 116]
MKDEMDTLMIEFLKAKYTKHLQSLDLNKKKGSSIFVINDDILELLVLFLAKNSLFPKDFEGYGQENSKILENLNEISKMIHEIHVKVDSLQ